MNPIFSIRYTQLNEISKPTNKNGSEKLNFNINIVDLVLWFLAALSLLIWTIAISKFFFFRKNTKANQDFLQGFSKVRDLLALVKLTGEPVGSIAKLGRAALDEMQAYERISGLSNESRREMLLHALREQAHLQQVRMESGLAVLASVGSTAPFIGLFGTVWGIMHALKNITATGSAGLDVVAGPIGEALIATAIGIATAIPAVLAYNYYLRKVKLSVAEMEHFASAFLNWLTKINHEGK